VARLIEIFYPSGSAWLRSSAESLWPAVAIPGTVFSALLSDDRDCGDASPFFLALFEPGVP